MAGVTKRHPTAFKIGFSLSLSLSTRFFSCSVTKDIGSSLLSLSSLLSPPSFAHMQQAALSQRHHQRRAQQFHLLYGDRRLGIKRKRSLDKTGFSSSKPWGSKEGCRDGLSNSRIYELRWKKKKERTTQKLQYSNRTKKNEKTLGIPLPPALRVIYGSIDYHRRCRCCCYSLRY